MSRDKKDHKHADNKINVEFSKEKNSGLHDSNEQTAGEVREENAGAEQQAAEGQAVNIPQFDAEKLSELEARVKELTEKAEAYEKENAELKDKLIRRAAEFDNYKRRTEKEKYEIAEFAATPFIKKILSVYDDMERSLNHMDKATNVDAIKDGLKMVFTKFNKVLDEEGVKKIEAKGSPFDFNFHEALLQQKAEGVEPHTVLEVVEAGYTYHDKVIRHAKVIVSEE